MLGGLSDYEVTVYEDGVGILIFVTRYEMNRHIRNVEVEEILKGLINHGIKGESYTAEVKLIKNYVKQKIRTYKINLIKEYTITLKYELIWSKYKSVTSKKIKGTIIENFPPPIFIPDYTVYDVPQ